MNKDDRKRIKDIARHRDVEDNLPAYVRAYMDAGYEYSLLRLVLHYYTMKEVQDEAGGIKADTYLSGVLSDIHTLLFQTLLTDDLKNGEDVLRTLHAIREGMTKHMTVLTSYTDALQIYEYVLNRVEYGITKEVFPVEESELAARVFRYLFRENDKLVINSKIQMVTGQLPIRMTKNRFFDYLTSTLHIYKGSDRSAVDDFVSMLKSTALLELPEGYEEAYPEICQFIRLLGETDYKSLDRSSYQALMEQFAVVTVQLTELVSDALLMMEIINDLYAALLALPYQKSEAQGTKVSISMLKGLHAAFLSEGEIPDLVDEGFEQIEGLQEQLGEDILQYESILQDVMTQYADLTGRLQLTPLLDRLLRISRLLSNSLFMDLEQEAEAEQEADADYIEARRRELEGLLTGFFEQHPKEVNRAVMAALFSNMPVLFNSQQEIKEYIEYSLNHCNNASELMACAKLLEEMMEEK